MKTPLIAIASFLLFAAVAPAEVEVSDGGTYILTGSFTFWKDKDMLTPFGKFDRGEFDAVVFKPTVNNFEGVENLQNTPASLKVRARETQSPDAGRVLVVTEILEIAPPGEAGKKAD